MFDYLANPTRFRKITTAILPVAVLVSAIALAFGLYLAFLASPADYQQGETVRIMYIHVPAAWMAMMCYLLMALSAVFYLVWRHPLADIGARAMALPGAGFALITLLTGSFWGRPMWGTWWVWDARLTSMLILFFLYLGYMALADGFERAERGSKPASLLLLVGVINLPIIKFSVDWWNTLHQGSSVLRLDGPSIDPAMLKPLLIMALAMLGWFIAITILRMNTLIMRRRITNLESRKSWS
ncbi:MAG: heme ABC transporter permease [Alphaproteobacteria bacterium]|jgi:heme exporter protein C|nr:heme ABC transporter permease [Alphaproteobacteria bacterium]MDG2466244.1 heme ABC transporter permease [Alphaproteobacteria bacterium]